VAFSEGVEGCDFLGKSQLGSRGFEAHPMEKCFSGAGRIVYGEIWQR
jgi:hypothetical protein